MFVKQPFLYVCNALDTSGAKSYVPSIPFPSCRDLCLTTTTDTTSCYILSLLGMTDSLAIKPFTTIVFYSTTLVQGWRTVFSSHQELPSSLDPRTKHRGASGCQFLVGTFVVLRCANFVLWQYYILWTKSTGFGNFSYQNQTSAKRGPDSYFMQLFMSHAFNHSIIYRQSPVKNQPVKPQSR